METQDLMSKSLSYYNFEAQKKKANIIDKLECQIWSDATELNRLEYTKAPELPKYVKPKVEPLSAGVWNMCRQILP